MHWLMKGGGSYLASVFAGDEQSKGKPTPQGEEALGKSECWSLVFQVAVVGRIWT